MKQNRIFPLAKLTHSLVLLSGGIDSTVLLLQKQQERHVSAVSFSYGASHNRQELAHATALAARYNVDHTIVRLPQIKHLLGGSLLRGGNLVGPDTVVPLRNAIFLSFASAIAASRGIFRVCFGATQSDARIYPDCRHNFVSQFSTAIFSGSDNSVWIEAPFVTLEKKEVVKIGESIGVPWEQTYSCYAGKKKHCGECGACQERQNAFLAAGVHDPTLYQKSAHGEANFARIALVGRVGESKDECATTQTGSPVAPGREH